MSQLKSRHYKDISPDVTVERIISKLYEMDIKVSERWYRDEEIKTESLRLNFTGSAIGCNGKGVDRNFARASAYGELFERYQNNMLCDKTMEMRKQNKSEFGFELAPDEKNLTIEEILNQGNSFTKFIEDKFNMVHMNDIEKVAFLLKISKPENEGKYLSLPFYSVLDNQVYYLPQSFYMKFYGSNGMAAGNTPEEAIIQGLSEIMERVVQKKVIMENLSLPDIPMDVLKRYPQVYDMFEKIRSTEGYHIEIKDCSLGGMYPVAALIIIEKDTGRYGIKFGSHPSMGIAIERAFTEATQGHSVYEYTNRSIFDFQNNEVTTHWNFENSIINGQAQYGYELFSNSNSYSFFDFDCGDMDNKEILKYCIKCLTKNGYDVLIRDVSYLGLPSYHIIVPGVSEVFEWEEQALKADNTFKYVRNLLHDPNQINKDNCKHIITSLNYFSKSILENRVRKYYDNQYIESIPYENIYCDCIYLSAMCNVIREEFDLSFQKLNYMLKNVDMSILEKEEVSKLKAITMYLSGRTKINDHKEVIRYISKFYNEKLCKEIDLLFEDVTKAIVRQYSFNKLNEKKMKDQMIRKDITRKLRKEQKRFKIDQRDLKLLFKSICTEEISHGKN